MKREKTLVTVSTILCISGFEIFSLKDELKNRFQYNIPKYYLSNKIHSNKKGERPDIIPREIKEDLIYSSINKDEYYYLFDIFFDFPISEEVSNCGIVELFSGIDFSIILNLPHIIKYKEFSKRFHNEKSNYFLMDYYYHNMGDGEYDLDIKLDGYYDKDFNFIKLPVKYIYYDYFLKNIDNITNISVILDSDLYDKTNYLYDRLQLNVEYKIKEIRKESDFYYSMFKTYISILIEDSSLISWYPLNIFIPADEFSRREYKLLEIIE